MKIIDNWAISRAKKLSDKVAADKELKLIIDKKIREDYSQLKKDAKAEIMSKLDVIADRMLKESCHIEVGDRVIFNKYSFERKASNSWDGGPYTYISNIKPEEKQSPLFAVIENIVVDYSYAEERIDQFISNLTADELKKKDILFTRFTNQIQHYGLDINDIRRFNPQYALPWSENLCLYKTAYFIGENTTFEQRLGLHVNSFLKANSEAGKITEEIWTEEIAIENKETELRIEQKNLKLRKQLLEMSYENNYKNNL